MVVEVGITGIWKEKCKLNDKLLMLRVWFEGGREEFHRRRNVMLWKS